MHDLRISLTDQCNLRCPYCMPAEAFGASHRFLHKDELTRFSELDRIIRAFIRCGVRKLRITGGEPLLRPGVVKFVRRAAAFPELTDIAMTTNGLRLTEMADELASAGLHRVTISLDAMSNERFGRMNGRGRRVEEVLAGIDATVDAGLSVKINMVVQRDVNEDEILPLARYCKERALVLRFIEFMDVGNYNHWRSDQVVTGAEVLGMLQEEFRFSPLEPAYAGEVARRFRYEDDGVEFGVIASVSQPFCGGCSRARLSADGKLYTCLFATTGFDLVGAMRRDNLGADEVYELIRKLWSNREDRYSELRSVRQRNGREKVEMSYIGG